MSIHYDKVTGEDFAGELCPDAAQIVQSIQDPNAPPVEATDVSAARKGHLFEAHDLPLITNGLTVDDRQIEVGGRHIGIRVYTPSGGESFPILLFAHGGCWTFCSLDSHDRICRFYADMVGCVVVSVDYRMAPEHPFPAALDDFYDALIWCFDHASTLRGDSERVAVAGDSAGGNLSAAAALRLQSHPKYRLCLQVLMYPICDVSDLSGDSMERYADGYFFTREVLAWTASLYTKGSDVANPEISPQYATVTPSLAPAFFIVAECDILRDQALDYAQKLRAADIIVHCNYYRGVPHAFIAMAGVLTSGLQALRDSADQLKQSFLS
jgi:acetyl esterase